MIYICIPALDEAETVGVLLWKVRRVMTGFGRDFHVLVLDDGSTDGTSDVVRPYARVMPLTLMRNDRSEGYAAALERLAREAVTRSTHPRRDSMVVLQGDFTESPDDIPALIKKIEGGADVVGSTVADVPGDEPRALRWSRRGLPWLLSRSAVPAEIRDPLAGFRAYRVQVLRRAFADAGDAPLLRAGGRTANAELLLKVAPHARRADDAEVGVRYSRRQRATRFRPWGALVETFNLARSAPRRRARPAEDGTEQGREQPDASGRRPRGRRRTGSAKQESTS